MKKLFFLLLLGFINIWNLKAQDMKLPPANNNSLFKQIAGTWISEPYDFMGVKWTDEAEFNWILNNQFMEMKVNTKGDNGFSFKSYGILSVDEEGNYKSWGFDEWGPVNAVYFEGRVQGNKLTSTGGSKYMKSSSEITVEGNTTTEVVTYSTKDDSGKETSSSLQLIYHRK